MDLNALSVFVKVVQNGGFGRAARALGMPNSTVSARVAALEERLGVTLLQRTTRRLHVTPVGEQFFRQCSIALETLQNAESEAMAGQSAPSGLLRVTAPQDFGDWILPDLSCELLNRYPQLELEWSFNDRIVDLLAEGFDLAIRAGNLTDSSMLARQVGQTYFAVFAAPGFAPALDAPDALRGHPCLRFTTARMRTWTLLNGPDAVTIPVTGPFLANSLTVLKELCVRGKGIALLPMFLGQQEVNQGRLVRLLPSWRSQASPVHILYPAQKFVPPRVRAFLDVADASLRAALAS